jgi:hypothetical protein
MQVAQNFGASTRDAPLRESQFGENHERAESYRMVELAIRENGERRIFCRIPARCSLRFVTVEQRRP